MDLPLALELLAIEMAFALEFTRSQQSSPHSNSKLFAPVERLA